MASFGNCADVLPEIDRVASAQPLGIAHESLPAAQIDAFVQRGTDPSFTTAAFELRGDHPRVVEHQHIAGAQKTWQIAHAQIGQRARPWHMQQPRRIARARRAQGYAIGGQVKIEQVNLHGCRARYLPDQWMVEWFNMSVVIFDGIGTSGRSTGAGL